MTKVDIDTGAAVAAIDAWQRNLIAECLIAGSTSAHDFLVDYHSKMTWRGDQWFGGAFSGEFADDVVKGWMPPLVSGNTATIENTFGLLAWKITGGTITPKNAQALAIPLIPEARGFSPRLMLDLFVAGNALVRKVGGQLEAVYALARSVTQLPWPGAMPTEDQLGKAFMDGLSEPIS
jgi:hypothetical protein